MTTQVPTPAIRPDRFNLWLTAAAVAAAVTFAVAWRRSHNPDRQWAKRVEEAHRQKIEQPLVRCFGGSTGAELRHLADTLHHGPLPAPFNGCFRGPMEEVMVAPNSFVESLQNPPLAIYQLRDRERGALLRLTASFRGLEQVVTRGGATPTDAQREAIAARLEDTAPEVDHERQAVEDLVRAARDAAPMF